MRRSIFIGLILTGMAVGVLLACTEVFTMAKETSKYTIITVETATGKIVGVADEKGNQATKVDPKEIEEIYDRGGFTHVSTILHAHSSPGCVYIRIRGWPVKVCVPQ